MFINYFKKESVSPDVVNPILENIGSSPIDQKVKLFGIIARPGINLQDLYNGIPALKEYIDTNFNNNIELTENQNIDSLGSLGIEPGNTIIVQNDKLGKSAAEKEKHDIEENA